MAERPELRRSQAAFTAYLRDPQGQPQPPGIEPRRLALYRELIFNNLDSILATTFPLVRQLLGDGAWQGLVGDFLREHRCQTPLYPEIGVELLDYLQRRGQGDNRFPPYLLELAHYEWVELALSLCDAELPAHDPDGDLLTGVPVRSPLAWSLTYRYAVHRIGPGCRPGTAPEHPTHLLVYRDSSDRAQFLEINGITQRLLLLLEEHPGWAGLRVLQQIAFELNPPDPQPILAAGQQCLLELRQRSILLGARPGPEGSTGGSAPTAITPFPDGIAEPSRGAAPP